MLDAELVNQAGRIADALERSNLLREYEILLRYGQIDAVREGRATLERQLWPERSALRDEHGRNPMNHIGRSRST